MRWDRLFEDLEGQLAARARLELDSEVAERTRGERARVTLGERIHGAGEGELVVHLRGGSSVRGGLRDVGDQWFLLEDAVGRQQLVLGPSVLGIEGLGRPRDDTRARRFAVGTALREVSRDRRAVVVLDVDGGRRHGTIDAVGADFLDLAEHPQDTPRRAEHVRTVTAIPFVALAAVVST
ncbi:hypothetical protein [Janibacter corallicola]|uniref:hypothetical protein n=1 Tax=Janibacter corallicola TaxID=415212 RepID=UPI00083207F5|nr:hypothetical protein [Janibacter corallicola]